jgi:Holliday junction resolvasome RuvABC endonuclease subunit
MRNDRTSEAAVIVLGLDLSLTAAAAVSVPCDWDGRWSRVRSVVVGERLRRDASDLERAKRTETIAARLVAFAQANGATVAYLESYGYAMRTSAHSLGEVGGVVRLELVRAGLDIRTANMGSARKLLLGKVPRSDAKVAVYTALRAAGAPLETADETDAMCAANWGLSELGGFCFAQAVAA